MNKVAGTDNFMRLCFFFIQNMGLISIIQKSTEKRTPTKAGHYFYGSKLSGLFCHAFKMTVNALREYRANRHLETHAPHSEPSITV